MKHPGVFDKFTQEDSAAGSADRENHLTIQAFRRYTLENIHKLHKQNLHVHKSRMQYAQRIHTKGKIHT